MQAINLEALFLIFLVALGTYSLRVSGLLFSNRFKNEGRVKIFLDFLPSTLLLALVVPSILKEGITGLIAMVFISLFMYKTKNILLSMLIGMLIVALSRNYF